MFRRLVLTLATAASLIGLCVVYQLAMRQIVEVPAPIQPPAETPSRTSYEPPEENRRIAMKYLPEWAAKSTLGLHTEHAFVYTNQWKRFENNKKQVEFKPFAMAWLMNDADGKESAISIWCESAVLEFEQEINDQLLKNPGRVVTAMFNEDVHLTGPNELEIVGQNFIFNENTLYLQTSYPVRFKYMAHRGLATKMKMKLIPAPGEPTGDRPRVYGIESVRLMGGANPIEPDWHFVLLSTQIPRGNEMVPATIRCNYDLTYDVVNNSAVLLQDVRARIGAKPNITALDCEKMTIQLTPKTPAVKSDSGAAPMAERTVSPAGNGFQSFNRDLEFRWMVAEGLRKDDLVVINSNEYGVVAKMQSLRYHAYENRVFMLSEHPDRPSVSIKRHGSQLYVPRVDFQYNADNSLKQLNCEGNGWLKFFDENTRKISLVATWQHILTVCKDEATDLHLVELHQNAQFRRPDQGLKLGADAIKIWLAKVDTKVDQTTAKTDSDPLTSSQTPEPKRLRAEGNVALTSPQMMIERTNELDIQIDDAAETAPKSTASTPTLRRDNQEQAIAANTLAVIKPTSSKTASGKPPRSKQPIEQSPQVGFANVPAEPQRDVNAQSPTTGNAASTTDKTNKRKTAQKPIGVIADKIHARMARGNDPNETEPREVTAEGNVEINQKGDHGEQALCLRGDIVHMDSQGGEQGTVHVYGRPATIQSPQMNLEGRDLNLDRATNRAWVRGAGEMKMPIPEDANLGELQAVADRNLHVRWKESMNFDGQKATFVGRVRSELGYYIVQCEEMTVTLADRISFEQQRDHESEKPALQLIRCRENVTFEATQLERNRLVGVFRGQVGELTVNHSTGIVNATGPGKVRVWQLDPKHRGSQTIDEPPQANRPIPTEITVWNFTRIDFEGTLTGKVDFSGGIEQTNRRFKVMDRVEVCHGPVISATVEVDPDRLPSLGGTMRCHQLDIVSYPPAERNSKGHFLLSGSGNTEVEGRIDFRVDGRMKPEMFTAQADRISYDEAKGMLKLSSNGKRVSQITGMVNQDASEIIFYPTTKEIYINGATGTRAKQ